MGYVSGQARDSGGVPFAPGGGGGGGITEITSGDGSIIITNPTGPTVDLSATPASIGAVDKTGDTMSGNLAMDGNNVVGAGSIAATGNVSAATLTGDLSGDVNGVTITDAGAGDIFLSDDGSYKSTGPAPLMAIQFSDAGNRAPGASLRSGGDLFGNLTPGSSAGQPTTGGTVRRVSWRRTVTPAGFIRVSAIAVATRTERAFILVAAGAGVTDGEATGLSFSVNAGEQIAVLWDATSSGTTQDLAVTVLVETAP